MIQQTLETSFYSSSLIASQHAMFTCQGGVSQSPYTGLNLSYAVGDDPAAVCQNRELVKQQLDVQYLASAVQIHSDRVAVVEGLGEDYAYKNVDALITQQSGVGLLIQQADCQAILLYDPRQQAVAAVHNGWRGSVSNIIAKTIRAMEENFCTSPRDIRAVISPSLGPCCAEFIHYTRELPVSFQQWQRAGSHFDFWEISRWQLQEAGLRSSCIEITGICTLCNQNFFSHRRAMKQQKKQQNNKGLTGRNGSVIKSLSKN